MIPADVAAGDKVSWRGEVLSVQPRIRLTRSFDERSHEYLGYSLRLYGRLGDEERAFTVAIGKAAHEKHGFRVGMEVSGQGHLVPDRRREPADLHRASRLRVHTEPPEPMRGPPWTGTPPALCVYRERGHRRLAKRAFGGETCRACLWACEMPVEMIIDHWNPGRRRRRTETFCYRWPFRHDRSPHGIALGAHEARLPKRPRARGRRPTEPGDFPFDFPPIIRAATACGAHGSLPRSPWYRQQRCRAR